MMGFPDMYPRHSQAEGLSFLSPFPLSIPFPYFIVLQITVLTIMGLMFSLPSLPTCFLHPCTTGRNMHFRRGRGRIKQDFNGKV